MDLEEGGGHEFGSGPDAGFDAVVGFHVAVDWEVY